MSRDPDVKTATATRKVHEDDVDDVIGIAAEMMDADEERLTVEELRDVALQLDIAPEYVDKAVAELERRRKGARAEEAEALAARKRVLGITAVALGVVMLSATLVLYTGKSGLDDLWATVEQSHAQVHNVRTRQAAIQEQYGEREPTPDVDAEITGAQNRVTVETRRYDKAARDYNAEASGGLGSVWVSLFDLPERAPLSNEVDDWSRPLPQ